MVRAADWDCLGLGPVSTSTPEYTPDCMSSAPAILVLMHLSTRGRSFAKESADTERRAQTWLCLWPEWRQYYQRSAEAADWKQPWAPNHLPGPKGHLREDPCSQQIQLSHQTHWTHADCIGTFLQRHPFKTGTQNFSPTRPTEKDKQNEKTEECVSNQRGEKHHEKSQMKQR